MTRTKNRRNQNPFVSAFRNILRFAAFSGGAGGASGSGYASFRDGARSYTGEIQNLITPFEAEFNDLFRAGNGEWRYRLNGDGNLSVSVSFDGGFDVLRGEGDIVPAGKAIATISAREEEARKVSSHVSIDGYPFQKTSSLRKVVECYDSPCPIDQLSVYSDEVLIDSNVRHVYVQDDAKIVSEPGRVSMYYLPIMPQGGFIKSGGDAQISISSDNVLLGGDRVGYLNFDQDGGKVAAVSDLKMNRIAFVNGDGSEFVAEGFESLPSDLGMVPISFREFDEGKGGLLSAISNNKHGVELAHLFKNKTVDNSLKVAFSEDGEVSDIDVGFNGFSDIATVTMTSSGTVKDSLSYSSIDTDILVATGVDDMGQKVTAFYHFENIRESDREDSFMFEKGAMIAGSFELKHQYVDPKNGDEYFEVSGDGIDSDAVMRVDSKSGDFQRVTELPEGVKPVRGFEPAARLDGGKLTIENYSPWSIDVTEQGVVATPQPSIYEILTPGGGYIDIPSEGVDIVGVDLSGSGGGVVINPPDFKNIVISYEDGVVGDSFVNVPKGSQTVLIGKMDIANNLHGKSGSFFYPDAGMVSIHGEEYSIHDGFVSDVFDPAILTPQGTIYRLSGGNFMERYNSAQNSVENAVNITPALTSFAVTPTSNTPATNSQTSATLSRTVSQSPTNTFTDIARSTTAPPSQERTFASSIPSLDPKSSTIVPSFAPDQGSGTTDRPNGIVHHHHHDSLSPESAALISAGVIFAAAIFATVYYISHRKDNVVGVADEGGRDAYTNPVYEVDRNDPAYSEVDPVVTTEAWGPNPSSDSVSISQNSVVKLGVRANGYSTSSSL